MVVTVPGRGNVHVALPQQLLRVKKSGAEVGLLVKNLEDELDMSRWKCLPIRKVLKH